MAHLNNLRSAHNSISKIEFMLKVYVFFILFFCSCKKAGWYDVKPDKSMAVPSTLKDLQALMDNAEVLSKLSPGLREVGSDGHYVTETVFQGMDANSKNAYTWSHDVPYANVYDWSYIDLGGSYKKVYYCNIVLEALRKLNPSGQVEQESWNSIKGQALFHRAIVFFDLAQVFAPSFQLSTASQLLGIPLRLESDINIPSKRSTVLETYDQIVKDLLEANKLLSKSNLPTTPLLKCRPTKVSTYALLARIYLSMENYSEGGNYADSCLALYNTLIDYNSLSTTSSSPIARFNPEIIFHLEMNLQFRPIMLSSMLVDPTWHSAYTPNDLRQNIFFRINNTTKLITVKGTYGGGNLFSGLATDEMYLIRAECYARNGKINEALNDINKLLRNRYNKLSPFTDVTANTSEDALKIVLTERKKELYGRGLRWTDLRRLNRDPRFATILTRTIGGNTYTLEPNSYRYTFPIPDDIIKISGMEQNPGWQ